MNLWPFVHKSLISERSPRAANGFDLWVDMQVTWSVTLWTVIGRLFWDRQVFGKSGTNSMHSKGPVGNTYGVLLLTSVWWALHTHYYTLHLSDPLKENRGRVQHELYNQVWLALKHPTTTSKHTMLYSLEDPSHRWTAAYLMAFTESIAMCLSHLTVLPP